MINKNNINWFPGHMKLAIDDIKKVLPLVDAVIEIGDARAPFSSLNNLLDKIIVGKKKILIFSKEDLADPIKLKKAMNKYAAEGIETRAINIKDPKDIKELLTYLSSIKTSRAMKYARYNLAVPPLRALVVGIPNVGKSTLINSLVGKYMAKVANKPGETKAQQLVKLGDRLELFDTPGVLQPNYEDKQAIMHLAWLGSLNDDSLPLEKVYSSLAEFMISEYLKSIYTRFGIPEDISLSKENLYEEIAKARKYMLAGNQYDIQRAKAMFTKEFRSGEIALTVVDDV
jgi:ribosome biogenesis GTPase A